MVRINLLPHRAAKRAEQQRQFGVMALLAAGLAAFLIFSAWSYLGAKKDAQNDRNRRLDAAILKLDKEIEDIKVLKDQIKSVLERKQIVENLQSNRSQAVVVLDELSRQLPDGMFVDSIKQQGDSILIQGVADTNARVATFVRNLSLSQRMDAPKLIEIKANASDDKKQNDFTLSVSLKNKQSVDDDEDKTKKAGAKK